MLSRVKWYVDRTVDRKLLTGFSHECFYNRKISDRLNDYKK